jgi:hypothetical protein
MLWNSVSLTSDFIAVGLFRLAFCCAIGMCFSWLKLLEAFMFRVVNSSAGSDSNYVDSAIKYRGPSSLARIALWKLQSQIVAPGKIFGRSKPLFARRTQTLRRWSCISCSQEAPKAQKQSNKVSQSVTTCISRFQQKEVTCCPVASHCGPNRTGEMLLIAQ